MLHNKSENNMNSNEQCEKYKNEIQELGILIDSQLAEILKLNNRIKELENSITEKDKLIRRLIDYMEY